MMPSSSSTCGAQRLGARRHNARAARPSPAVAKTPAASYRPAACQVGKLRRPERKLELAPLRQFRACAPATPGCSRHHAGSAPPAAENGRPRPCVSPDAAAAAACACGSTARCRTSSGRPAWRSGHAGRTPRDDAAPPPRPGASPPGKTAPGNNGAINGSGPTASKPPACAASSSRVSDRCWRAATLSNSPPDRRPASSLFHPPPRHPRHAPPRHSH